VGEDGMTTIAPNDPNILYSPYTWLVTAQMAKTINAGAYLRVAFTGTPGTLTATFDVSAGNYSPRVAIRYDGGPWQETQVAGSSVPIALTQTIPADANLFNTWGTHVVEIMMIASSEGVDRWASQLNALKFTGLVADVAVATKPVRARPLYGFLIGDSIAEGVRALNVTATGDQRRNDNRLAWTGPLRELLGAEIGVAGFGGVGVAGSGSGGVPQFSDSVPYLWSGQPRNLAVPQAPDFVVAHIGTNDGSKTDAAVTAGATALMNYLIANTPKKTAILVLPGWLQTKAAAIQAGIAASLNPGRVQFVDTTGWWNAADSADGLHPYGYSNVTDLAPRLAAIIRSAVVAKANAGGIVLYRTDAGQWVESLAS
jgi:lysophospholipase L1-like esterase